YPSRIEKVDPDEGKILIHFERWNHRYDEWIDCNSPRLRPLQRTSLRREGLKQEEPAVGAVPFKVGDEVLARWIDCRYYPAKIITINKEDTYSVRFYDGFVKDVKSINVKEMPEDLKNQNTTQHNLALCLIPLDSSSCLKSPGLQDWTAIVKSTVEAQALEQAANKSRARAGHQKQRSAEARQREALTPWASRAPTAACLRLQALTQKQQCRTPHRLGAVVYNLRHIQKSSLLQSKVMAAKKRKSAFMGAFQAKRARLNQLTGILASKLSRRRDADVQDSKCCTATLLFGWLQERPSEAVENKETSPLNSAQPSGLQKVKDVSSLFSNRCIYSLKESYAWVNPDSPRLSRSALLTRRGPLTGFCHQRFAGQAAPPLCALRVECPRQGPDSDRRCLGRYRIASLFSWFSDASSSLKSEMLSADGKVIMLGHPIVEQPGSTHSDEATQQVPIKEFGGSLPLPLSFAYFIFIWPCCVWYVRQLFACLSCIILSSSSAVEKTQQADTWYLPTLTTASKRRERDRSRDKKEKDVSKSKKKKKKKKKTRKGNDISDCVSSLRVIISRRLSVSLSDRVGSVVLQQGLVSFGYINTEFPPGTSMARRANVARVRVCAESTDGASVADSVDSLGLEETSGNADDSQDEDGAGGDEIVRCSCGINEETGFMIQCEMCSCWQHSVCMGFTEENIPDRYSCHVCQDPPGKSGSS
uniref:PHD finger protein 20-like protein 1 n=1 Tax=Petromyzon marinus TaxID=7757 RepID=S4RFR6_PETMA